MKNPGKTPLLKGLAKQQRTGNVPFHMPGHKKGRAVYGKFAKMLRANPFALDLTELPGLDDLHRPTGPIKEAQMRAARLFGAEHTFFLVNGTTVGIHAAILGTCRQGDGILLPRDVHRSVMGACILAGVRPYYLRVALEPDFGIACPPPPAAVEEFLAEHPGIKAVFYTYPSYYGLAGHLREVAAVVHKYNIPLLVDEAHGAHFVFSRRLPPTALECGADLTVQSTHKTLGALTQASMLHIKSHLINVGEVERQLRILQSTSPSYLLMASLDAAVGHLETSGQALAEKTIRLSQYIRDELKHIPGVRCMGPEVKQHPGVMDFDPTKVYFSLADLGLSGNRAAEILLKECGIQVELSDRDNLLLMLSIGNSREDVRRLAAAVKDLAARALRRRGRRGAGKNLPAGGRVREYPLPKVALTPREAWFAASKAVPLREAAGEVSAEMAAPYPPGIPLLCPGETITPEIIELLEQLKAEGACFHGPEDPDLQYISVVDRL